MIAARPIKDLTKGFGRNAFDLPVAALAAIAAAFIAFAMPADLLGRLVVATGLPHLLAAAEPPLGLKARAGIGLAGAAFSFGLVYMLLRLLDAVGRRRAQFEAELVEEDRPRLRRRDFHPDAPACRPISVTRDFGEPAPPPLASADPGAPAALAEPAPTPEADREAEAAWSEEMLELTERPAPAWLAEDEPEAVVPEPAPAPAVELEPEPAPAPAPEPQPQPRTEPAPQMGEATLADLMQRLERGLARRHTRQVFATAPQQHAPAPQVFPEANDDRLQSAIESLQRFAARGE